MTNDVAVLDEYAVRLGGCHVLLASPQACLDVLRSLQESVKAAGRQGLPAPARIIRLMKQLQRELDDYRAGAFARETAKPPTEPDLPSSSLRAPVQTEEAAQMLQLSPQRVRKLGAQLGGRRVGRVWVFDCEVIQAEVQRRRNQERKA